MKLELKHLDFANNGKVRLTRLPHWDFENVDLQDCELAFNDTSKKPFLRYRDVTFNLDQIRLYKRPTSDLTKEIEVNGEKFVPIEKLKKLLCYLETDLSIQIDPTSEGYSCECISTVINFKDYYSVVEKLYKWHFDIHGLIEAGLAIDINTLNESK